MRQILKRGLAILAWRTEVSVKAGDEGLAYNLQGHARLLVPHAANLRRPHSAAVQSILADVVSKPELGFPASQQNRKFFLDR